VSNLRKVAFESRLGSDLVLEKYVTCLYGSLSGLYFFGISFWTFFRLSMFKIWGSRTYSDL